MFGVRYVLSFLKLFFSSKTLMWFVCPWFRVSRAPNTTGSWGPFEFFSFATHPEVWGFAEIFLGRPFFDPTRSGASL